MKDESIYLAMLAVLTQHELAELFGKELQRRCYTGVIIAWDQSSNKITSAAALPFSWREAQPGMSLSEEISC